MRNVICDGCPCLNNDYEQGSECNLGYTTNLFWFHKITGDYTPDSNKMRMHQNDYNLHNASSDCKLIKIISEDEELEPSVYNGKTPLQK